MNDKYDLLENAELKRNPFDIPEGYFDSVENNVREKIRISKLAENDWIEKLKPAFVMGIMFLAISGFGILASRITEKMGYRESYSDNPIFALIDEGYIDSGFIYEIYTEVDVRNVLYNSLENSSGLDAEIEFAVESSLTQEELVEYLLERTRQ